MISTHSVAQADHCPLRDSLHAVIHLRLPEGPALKHHFGSRLMILDRNRLGRISSHFILVFSLLVCLYVSVIVRFLLVFLSFES